MGMINDRIEALRELMRREGIAACIFPSTDPHNSEYVADHWKGREWISGFNGSAGTAVVTMRSAALWTDSRYFIAAAQQLEGSEFVLMKEKIDGTPTIAEWIGREVLAEGGSTEVAIDGWCASEASVKALRDDLRRHGGLTLRTNLDPLSRIWTDRPPLPLNKVEVQPMEYAGEAAADKLKRLRRRLHEEHHADGLLVAALDDIAWLLNLRGSDIHCNPVFVAYLLIASDRATLYVDHRKITAEVEVYLRGQGVLTDDYNRVGDGLKDYFEYTILLDPDEVNTVLYHKPERPKIISATSPVAAMKAVKNPFEIEGFRGAMLRDGVAMVKFLSQLDEMVAEGTLTEIGVDKTLTRLRAMQPLYKGLSFDTIAAYGAHAAIVHYEATPETDVCIEPCGMILIDSGAQYQDGTTDITRTIALGPLSEEERLAYTLVLKGHIQLQMLKFPKGASGTQLDAIARHDMWSYGYNYLHGTGHGVGSYLNVHEGPHQIRMEYRGAPLVAGMTVTDEPGIYAEDRFGVRIENTLLVIPYKKTEFGEFLQFEPLTLCPIDTRPVITDLLTIEEISWLNAYHATVRERLLPHLTPAEQQWLNAATVEI
ncbi:MAG: aminopeptidase P family protein [Prevotella sp.]|nr:aminopeptidase P family protein [Prevotella sp.]